MFFGIIPRTSLTVTIQCGTERCGHGNDTDRLISPRSLPHTNIILARSHQRHASLLYRLLHVLGRLTILNRVDFAFRLIGFGHFVRHDVVKSMEKWRRIQSKGYLLDMPRRDGSGERSQGRSLYINRCIDEYPVVLTPHSPGVSGNLHVLDLRRKGSRVGNPQSRN